MRKYLVRLVGPRALHRNAFGQAKDVVRDINESASLLQKMLMVLTRLIIAMEVNPAYFILSTRPAPPSSPVSDDHLPEPRAAVTEAADETEMPLPSDPQTFFLGGLFALGVLAALYVASSIILPVVLAFVLNLLLQPAVRLLGRVHLPRAVGALLTVLLVIGALIGLVAALSVPAANWAERLPEGIPRLEAHLQVIKGPMQALQKVIQQAEQVADAPPSRVRSFRFAAILA